MRVVCLPSVPLTVRSYSYWDSLDFLSPVQMPDWGHSSSGALSSTGTGTLKSYKRQRNLLAGGEGRGGRMEGSVTTVLPCFDFYFRRCDSFDACFLCCHIRL